MGIQPKGAFGGFRNKTGPLVGHLVNGQNVITSVPNKSSKPPTLKQLDQRMRFGLVTSYLSWMSALIEPGFQGQEEKQSPMNRAVQYNLRYAVTGISPNFSIDHAKMVYSLGKCPLPAAPIVEALVGAKANFSWGASFLNKYGKITDLVNVVVYHPEKNLFVILEGAADRSELNFSLQLPADFIGDTVYCYLNFVSLSGKLASNSKYLGQMLVV